MFFRKVLSTFLLKEIVGFFLDEPKFSSQDRSEGRRLQKHSATSFSDCSVSGHITRSRATECTNSMSYVLHS